MKSFLYHIWINYIKHDVLGMRQQTEREYKIVSWSETQHPDGRITRKTEEELFRKFNV